MAATSQPIAFSVADNSSDIYMTSGSYRSRNGSISASYYMGSPTSWRAGSFGSRFYPGCSPGQLLGPLDPSEFKCAKMSSSLESDSGLMSVLGAPEREDEFCKNYSCCGLQIDDLHGLLQHVEEIHGSATDVFGNPQPIVSVCPTPIRTQSSYFPDTPLQTSSHGSFDPDDMDLDDEDQSSTPSSSNGPTPPDTPISTPLLSHPINSFNHYVSSKLSDAHIPVSPFAFPSSRSTPPIGSITPEAFNGYAGYTDYSSSMPGTVPSPRASEEPSQPASPVSDPGSPYGCLPPSLVFSATTTPANTPAHSRVPSPSSATRASVPATVGVQASTSSDSAAGPSVVAKASGSSSSAQSSARASTTLSRPSSSLLLSKPFRCPKLNCNKSYKQANGLKYHLTHGSCNFAPPKDLEQVQALLASKRSQREAAGEQNAQNTLPDLGLGEAAQRLLEELEHHIDTVDAIWPMGQGPEWLDALPNWEPGTCPGKTAVPFHIRFAEHPAGIICDACREKGLSCRWGRAKGSDGPYARNCEMCRGRRWGCSKGGSHRSTQKWKRVRAMSPPVRLVDEEERDLVVNIGERLGALLMQNVE